MTGDGSGGPDLWYVNRDGQQVGPLDGGEVQRRFTSGDIRAHDAVWRAGWPDWYPAGEVFKSLIVPPPMRAFAPPPPEPEPGPKASTANPSPQSRTASPEEPEGKAGNMVGKVSLIGRTVTIHRFTGTVMASQRSSKTTVSGGSNNQPVTSHTVHTNEVFVRLPDDSERTFDVEPAGIPVRPGNTLTFLLGAPEGKENGFYTTVWNHDLRQMGHLSPGINKMAGPPFYFLMYVLLGIACIAGVLMSIGRNGNPFLLVLAVAATVGLFILTQVNRSKLRAAAAKAIADLRT